MAVVLTALLTMERDSNGTILKTRFAGAVIIVCVGVPVGVSNGAVW